MPLSPRHWRARHLLGAWIVYWAALLAVVVGPAALALWRMRGAPPNTSSASLSFGDEGVVGSVTQHGAKVWALTASGWTVLLWLVGPPLLLWLVWLLLRPRAGLATVGDPPRGLGAGAPDWERGAPAERDAVRTTPRGDR
jgi:hypothetical protein